MCLFFFIFIFVLIVGPVYFQTPSLRLPVLSRATWRWECFQKLKKKISFKMNYSQSTAWEVNSVSKLRWTRNSSMFENLFTLTFTTWGTTFALNGTWGDVFRHTLPFTVTSEEQSAGSPVYICWFIRFIRHLQCRPWQWPGWQQGRQLWGGVCGKHTVRGRRRGLLGRGGPSKQLWRTY